MAQLETNARLAGLPPRFLALGAPLEMGTVYQDLGYVWLVGVPGRVDDPLTEGQLWPRGDYLPFG